MPLEGVDHTHSNGILTLCFLSVTVLKIAFLWTFLVQSLHRWSQLYVSYHSFWRNDEQLDITSGFSPSRLLPLFPHPFFLLLLFWSMQNSDEYFISTIHVTLPAKNILRLMIRKKQAQPFLELCPKASGGGYYKVYYSKTQLYSIIFTLGILIGIG